MMSLAALTTGDFIAMQGDDDFLVPASFERAAAVLNGDPTVSCAQGRGITIWNFHTTSPGVGRFKLWEASEDIALERFCELMKHYTFTWYALYRREQFIEHCAYMVEMRDQSEDFVFFECIGDVYAVIKGKIVISNDLYIMRGAHDNNGSLTLTHDDPYKMAPYLLLSPSFSRSLQTFKRLTLRMFEVARRHGSYQLRTDEFPGPPVL